jgi:hypothetical protein
LVILNIININININTARAITKSSTLRCNSFSSSTFKHLSAQRNSVWVQQRENVA